NLGPYHLVSCSATMTGGMPDGGAAPPDGFAVRRPRPTSNPDCVTYSNICGACELRALPAGPSGSWAVMKLAFSRPCSTRMYSYAFRIPVGLYASETSGQEVLRDVLREVDVVTRQDDRTGLRQAHDRHLATRSVARPALEDDAAVAEYIQVTRQLLHLELVWERLAEVVPEARDVARDVGVGRPRLGPGRVLHLVSLDEEDRLRELADIPAVIEVHMADGHVFDVIRRQPDLLELCIDGDVRAALGGQA